MFRFSNIPKYAIKRSQNECKNFSSNSSKAKLSEIYICLETQKEKHLRQSCYYNNCISYKSAIQLCVQSSEHTSTLQMLDGWSLTPQPCVGVLQQLSGTRRLSAKLCIQAPSLQSAELLLPQHFSCTVKQMERGNEKRVHSCDGWSGFPWASV